MTVNNILNNSLSGQTGSGNFVGAQEPAMVNPTANNFNEGFITTATAAGTTTLTVASNRLQYFTGSTTQAIVLPVVATLVLGQSYSIVNQSTGILTIESSGANTITTVAPGATVIVTCILITGTTAASWAFITIPLPPGASFTWNNVAGTTQAIAVNNGYASNNSAQTTFTLPATAAFGDVVIVKGVGVGGWIIDANTGQTIVAGAVSSSSGGSVTSAAGSDSIHLTCLVANTTWSVDYAFSSGLNLV